MNFELATEWEEYTDSKGNPSWYKLGYKNDPDDSAMEIHLQDKEGHIFLPLELEWSQRLDINLTPYTIEEAKEYLLSLWPSFLENRKHIPEVKEWLDSQADISTYQIQKPFGFSDSSECPECHGTGWYRQALFGGPSKCSLGCPQTEPA